MKIKFRYHILKFDFQKLFKKFFPKVYIGKYLIERKYTSFGKIIGMGGSAGGLLMGVVVNQAPELFLGVIMAFEDFYTDLLQDQPQMAYQAAVTSQYPTYDTATRPRQRERDYWSKQYSNIYNRFLGNRGQEMRSQKDPSKWTTFSQYLENQATQNPYTQRYAARTPYERGVSTRRFAPSTRFITY